MNPCYLFEDAEIGLCGRNCDVGALSTSALADELDDDRDSVLGAERYGYRRCRDGYKTVVINTDPRD